MKDQPKHTPGPWKVTRNNTGVRSVDAHVCRVWMLRNGHGVANARLIAAAPDLLEALKILSDYPIAGGYALGPCISECDMKEIRAAIAKAEGRGE